MTRHSFLLVFLLSITCPSLSWALDEAAVEQLLQRGIIGAESVLAEVQIYAERRIPRMSAFASTQQWQQYASNVRQKVLTNVVYRGDASRG